MNIIHIIESGGGSADFVLYLVQYLPHHHHIIIYSDRTFGNRLSQIKHSNPNVSFHLWGDIQREINLSKDFKAAIFLYRLLKNINDGVIHLHSSKAGFIGRIVCFLLKKKQVIYTPNGLPFLRKDITRLKRSIFLILEIIAQGLNGKIICCSKSEADEFLKRKINCTYINNGTEIFDYPKIKRDGEGIIIATTGRATIQKNPALFNEIAKHFEADPTYKFVWIGSGELQHLLTSKNVKITGWVNRNEVVNILAQSDVYLSTASWEGLPFAVLEAMNLNKPLILSHCVGNVDLVTNNYNGFSFYSKKDAIRGISFFKENKNQIGLFGCNSYKIVLNNFNVILMAKNYERAYASLNKLSNG